MRENEVLDLLDWARDGSIGSAIIVSLGTDDEPVYLVYTMEMVGPQEVARCTVKEYADRIQELFHDPKPRQGDRTPA